VSTTLNPSSGRPRVIDQANYAPLSPLTFISRARWAFPGKAAVVDADGTQVTYETLGGTCDALAGALRAHGIAPGDRVAVLDHNSLLLLAAHFGVPGAGAALVALNSRLAAQEYRGILAHSRARLLLVSPELVSGLGVRSAGDLPVETVVMLPDGDASDLPGSIPYDAWLARADTRGIEMPSDENAMIAVNYTSGTTGRPKGVTYTHRGAFLNALSVALEFELTSSSWHMWTLPMFHCNGWSLTWGVTAVGATHVCLPSFDAERALDLMASYPVTHLCGAPIVLSDLARAGSRQGFRADRLVRAAGGGGSPAQETNTTLQAT
jgi:fatty-acyl-CoA synthase